MIALKACKMHWPFNLHMPDDCTFSIAAEPSGLLHILHLGESPAMHAGNFPLQCLSSRRGNAGTPNVRALSSDV